MDSWKEGGGRPFQLVEIFVEFEGGCIETLRGVLKFEKKRIIWLGYWCVRGVSKLEESGFFWERKNHFKKGRGLTLGIGAWEIAWPNCLSIYVYWKRWREGIGEGRNMEIYARIVGILRIIKGIGSVAGATRAILLGASACCRLCYPVVIDELNDDRRCLIHACNL